MLIRYLRRPNDYRRGPMLIITEDVAEREAGIVDIGPGNFAPN